MNRPYGTVEFDILINQRHSPRGTKDIIAQGLLASLRETTSLSLTLGLYALTHTGFGDIFAFRKNDDNLANAVSQPKGVKPD